MTDAEISADDEAGLGALQTERGNLPLERIRVRAGIIGLTSQVEQRLVIPFCVVQWVGEKSEVGRRHALRSCND